MSSLRIRLARGRHCVAINIIRAPDKVLGSNPVLTASWISFMVILSSTPWSCLYYIADWSASYQLLFLTVLFFEHLAPLAPCPIKECIFFKIKQQGI